MFPEAPPITPPLSVQFLREFRLRLLRDEAAAEGIAPMSVAMFLPAQRWFLFGTTPLTLTLTLTFRLLAPFPPPLPKLSCCERGLGLTLIRWGLWESKAYAASEQLLLLERPFALKLPNEAEDEADRGFSRELPPRHAIRFARWRCLSVA